MTSLHLSTFILSTALVLGGLSCSKREFQVTSGIVRVARLDRSGLGSGFFIAGPEGDPNVYVATAFHLVAEGKPLIVESVHEVSDRSAYVTAFSEVEVAAIDPSTDLAILRLENVPPSIVTLLPLAEQTLKDEAVVSYGFPDSNLTKEMGLTKKPGSVLNIAAKLPYIDHKARRIIRADAADGVIISVDIEPGFSGGPTCNLNGEVVGINVLKDKEHVGQNAAVSVSHLRALLAKIKPTVDPSKEEVEAVLIRLRDEYLALPLSERSKAAVESEYLAISELERVTSLIDDILSEEADSDPKRGPIPDLSRRASLGLTLARLPGKILETYHSDEVKNEIEKCRKTADTMKKWFGELAGDSSESSGADECTDIAFRPLVWDLVAAILQWQGEVVDYRVSKIDVINPDKKIYRANVSIGKSATIVPLVFAYDYGQLRLKLFDEDGSFQLNTPYTMVTNRDLEGTWHLRRAKKQLDHNVTVSHDETIEVVFDNPTTVSLRHTVTTVQDTGDRRKFGCSKKATVTEKYVQALSGKFGNGTIIALPVKPILSVREGTCTTDNFYSEDKGVVLKILGDRLQMYRTNGSEFPEVAEFRRE